MISVHLLFPQKLRRGIEMDSLFKGAGDGAKIAVRSPQ